MLRTTALLALCLGAGAPDDIVPPSAPPKQPAAAPPAGAPAAKAPADPVSLPPTNPKWLEKLEPIDRAALDAGRGYRLPTVPLTGTWLGGAPAPESLKGKVILIQSFTTASPSGKSALTKAVAAAKTAVAAGDLVVLGLHTPEGAPNAPKALRKPAAPTLVDETGAFCDAVGVFRQPVNILIDRDGTIRYAGLTTTGLKGAIAELCAEPARGATAPDRPAAAAAPTRVDLPAPTDGVDTRFTQDRRGQPAPTFYVESWLTQVPDPTGKVLVLDFWATWCVPCVAAIPHMNELAQHYGNHVTVVGISSEAADACRTGMNAKSLRMGYAIASDPSGAMSGFYGVKGIPACVVVTSDGIVRWQGAPDGLTAGLLDPIVRANDAWFAENSAAMKDGRWAKALKDAPDRPIDTPKGSTKRAY